MRDKIKNAEYFDGFIEEDSVRIKKFVGKLEAGEVKSERIFPVKAKVHDMKLGILIAKYSKGEELCLLEREYLALLEECWEADYYNKNLKMISLGVLFRVNKASAKKIKSMLEKSNIHDWLYDYLLNSWSGEQSNECEQLLFSNYFSDLQKIVFKDNKIELLKKYLSDNWYNEDCGCYDAHKSKQNIYYGYWSFEAGAIAKILNLDDSSLKDVPYYPYDLVHYKK